MDKANLSSEIPSEASNDDDKCYSKRTILEHRNRQKASILTYPIYCIPVLALRGGALTDTKDTSNKTYFSSEILSETTHLPKQKPAAKQYKKLIARIGNLKTQLKIQLENCPHKFHYKIKNRNRQTEEIQTLINKIKRLRAKLKHYNKIHNKGERAKHLLQIHKNCDCLSGPSPTLEERESRTLPQGEMNGNQTGPASNTSALHAKQKNRHKRSQNALVNRTLRRALIKKLRRQTARGRRKLQADPATQPVTQPVAQDQGNLSLPNSRFDPTHPQNKQPDKGAGIYQFLWKEEIEHLKTTINKHTHTDTHSIVATNTKIKNLKIAFWNTKGCAHLAARQKLICTMERNKIYILFLAETHINTNSTEEHDGYTFYFSTKITDKQRKEAEDMRKKQHQNKANGKGKGKNPNKGNTYSGIELHNLDAEKLGTAVIFNKQTRKYVKDCIQTDDRQISLILGSSHGEIICTGVHAPHADATELSKKTFFDQLRTTHEKFNKKANIHYILGDFNTKILNRVPAEQNNIGPHIYNPLNLDIDSLSTGQKENRENLLELCLENNLIISNTWFQKAQHELMTFHTPHVENFLHTGENYTQFAQFDLVLTPNKWKNSIQDINTKIGEAFESDHKIILADIRIKLAKNKKTKEEKVERYRKPSEEQQK